MSRVGLTPLLGLSVAIGQECPSSLQTMQGLQCRTDDSAVLATVQVSSEDACCSACSERSDCGAFTFAESQYGSSTCTLKTHCKEIEKASGGSSRRRPSTSSAVSGAFTVDQPARFCPVPYLGAGYECSGETIQSVSYTSSIEDCCDKCQEVDGCFAFSRSKSGGQCDLKSGCTNKIKSSSYDTAWAPQIEPTSWQYKVGLGSFKVPGYQCGDRDETTLVFYPEPKVAGEKFHVVVYAHGLGGYLDDGGNRVGTDNGLDSWMQDVASTGLIVVVPFTGMGFHQYTDSDDGDEVGISGCGKEYEDMLLALNHTRLTTPSVHPAFDSADWSRVGTFGHSMGGSGACRVAEYGADSGLNIVAGVASHGAASVTNLNVPMLFTTGTLDTKDHDDDGNLGHFKHEFEISSAPTKVFVNLKGGYHMEVCEGKRLNFLTAQFLSCHVNQNQDHCDYIYGSDGLCARNDLGECVIVQPNATALV